MFDYKDKTIEEIAEKYTELKPYKSNYFIGLCPLHSERTPSFFISIQFQSFKCFGCGKYGKKWKLLKELGEIKDEESFEERKRFPKTSSFISKNSNNNNYNLNEIKLIYNFAKNFVYSVLFKKAQDYLLSRGLDKKTIIYSNIGYIPSKIDIPREIWKIKNQTENIIFPIYNIKNELISFSSRSILEKKYMHSTGFKTKENLYFLPYIFEDSENKNKEIFLCEGFFDVLLPAVKKIPAISIFGSSISDEQVILINSLIEKNNLKKENLVLSFDKDLAGFLCTIEVFEKLGIESIKIIDWEKYKEEINDIGDLFSNKEKINENINEEIKKCDILDFLMFAFEKSEEFRKNFKNNFNKLKTLKNIFLKKEYQIRFIKKVLKKQNLFKLFLDSQIRPIESFLLIALNISIWKNKVNKFNLEKKTTTSVLNEKMIFYFGVDNKILPSITNGEYIENSTLNQINSLEQEIEIIEKYFERKKINYGN